MKGGLTLWGFKLLVKDPKTGGKRYGVVTKDGAPLVFLGKLAEAARLAATYQAEAAQRITGKVTVRAAAREQVGPMTVRQVLKVGGEREMWKTVARYMAFRMAEATARASLELNPNIAALAEVILDEAMQAALDDVNKVRARKPGALVDAQGNPLGA